MKNSCKSIHNFFNILDDRKLTNFGNKFGVRSGFCGAGLAEFSTLVKAAEDNLFRKILYDASHACAVPAVTGPKLVCLF